MKRLLFFCLLIPVLSYGQIPTDKKYHAGAGVIIGIWGTFAGNSIDLAPEKSAIFGMGSVAVAGLGKELWDEIDYGGWDWKDFGATMIGGVVGTGLTYAGLKIFKKHKPVVIANKNEVKIGVSIKF